MRHIIPIACLLLLTLCACGMTSPASLSSAAYTLPPATERPSASDALLDALRETGATVERVGGAAQYFLSAAGETVEVDGERIQIYAYPDADAAAADAARFSADGGQVSTDAGVLRVNWVATPHLYRADRLLVIYLGDDAGTLAALDRALGGRFAGGANPFQVARSGAPVDIR